MKTLVPDQLPVWMRPRHLVIDWGVVLILGFSLITGWSLIARPGLRRGTEVELYERRATEVTRLLAAGIPFSRWAPYMTYGYGSPLFNYLAPLPHYLAGYFQAFTDTDPEDTIKVLLLLSIAGAGTGMYFFVRARWGAESGFLAALIYLFSPPLLLTLPYTVGDLALLMALALLPWTLWALDGLWATPDRRWFLVAILVLSAFILTDTRILLFGSIVILVSRLPHLRSPSMRFGLGAILIAIAITAFYWFPALLERDAITWTPAGLEPLAGSVGIGELLAPTPRYDLRLINPPPYRGLGVGTWILAGVGVLAMLTVARRCDTFLFFGLGVVAIAIVTPGFTGLWPPENAFMPLLPYHSELVGLFCLSAIAGEAVQVRRWLPRRWGEIPAIVILGALCLIPVLVALPALYPREWDAGVRAAQPVTGLDAELRAYEIGSFHTGILLPASAPSLPAPHASLLAGLRDNNPVFNRFDPLIHPNHPSDLTANTPLSEHYVFGSAVPLTTELFLLNYPGWSASINGINQSPATSPRGFITVHLPDGPIDFRLWLDGTPIRFMAWLITAMGLIGLAIASIRRWWPADEFRRELPILPRREVVGMAIILAASAGTAWYIHYNPESLLPRSESPQFYSLSSQPVQPLGRLYEGMYLLGYNASATSVGRGDTLMVTLFWEAGRSVVRDLQSEVRLIGPAGNSSQVHVLVQTHRHPGGIPTRRWRSLDSKPGDIDAPDVGPGYVHDDFLFTVAPEMPSGDYFVQITLGNCGTPSLTVCDNPIALIAVDPLTSERASVLTIPQFAIHVR